LFCGSGRILSVYEISNLLHDQACVTPAKI
jgi:hypothetical protein